MAKSLTQIWMMPHTPRNPHTSVREVTGTIQPVLNLLNFAVLRIMTLISAFVSYSDHFWYADFHFSPRERTSGLLHSLEDSIHIVDVLPNKLTYGRVIAKDFIELAVWA